MASRTLSTCPFTPPDVRPAALERPRPDGRLPPDDLREPLEERLDGLRLLLDAVLERDFALEPLEPLLLDPLRDELERRPELERPLPLDEPRLVRELLFCPDLEVPWAILASLCRSVGVELLRVRSADGERLL
jgi:hypothetical protein